MPQTTPADERRRGAGDAGQPRDPSARPRPSARATQPQVRLPRQPPSRAQLGGSSGRHLAVRVAKQTGLRGRRTALSGTTHAPLPPCRRRTPTRRSLTRSTARAHSPPCSVSSTHSMPRRAPTCRRGPSAVSMFSVRPRRAACALERHPRARTGCLSPSVWNAVDRASPPATRSMSTSSVRTFSQMPVRVVRVGEPVSGRLPGFLAATPYGGQREAARRRGRAPPPRPRVRAAYLPVHLAARASRGTRRSPRARRRTRRPRERLFSASMPSSRSASPAVVRLIASTASGA